MVGRYLKGVTLMVMGSVAGMWAPETRAQTVVEYIHTDALGSPVAKSNAAGAIIERSIYEPFGEELTHGAQDAPGFTGHVADASTGLDYMQQRYYDPEVGRFLSTDPVVAYDRPVLNFNRYEYALNSPYSFTDPDGRESVGEMIDSNAMAAVARGSTAGAYGWSFAAVSWKFLGAESISQIADKGWSGTTSGDKAGAGLEVLAALPPVKIVGEIATLSKEVTTIGRGTEVVGNSVVARATQGAVFQTTREASRAAESMGFRKINERISGQAIYKRGKEYITRDIDGHNGGAWKLADSVEALGSRETRTGTFNADLSRRVGD